MTARTLARIVQMDRSELAWRTKAAARIVADRTRAAVATPNWDRRRLGPALAPTPDLADARAALGRRDWNGAQRELARQFSQRRSRFVVGHSFKSAIVDRITSCCPGAVEASIERADRLASGEYDLLGYRGLRFDAEGGRPDWHLDPVYRRHPPQRFWATVPYLDASVCGDHKIIWELNRHQHWMALGRAFWLSGDSVYRERMLMELGSWLDANPPLVGINWASMLELALRSLSWLWALELFAGAAHDDDPPWIVDLLVGLDRQLTQIERNLSYYFSPNTHLLGEALALYVIGRALPELAASDRWAATGRRVLVAETTRQILPDGGYCERSTHYHRYALDFYLLALALARITGDSVAGAFGGAVARLATAARLMADDHGRVPHIGDDDAGMLLPIAGRDPDDLRDSLTIAAALVDRPDLRVGPMPEEACWMLAHPALEARLDGLGGMVGAASISSGALSSTGFYVSRSEAGDHLVIDGGPHGYQNGGHAHADALALTFSANGMPLLIDPGTGSYTANTRLRDRLRSSASHNTLVVDGLPQSTPGGPFRWLRTADSRVHRWRSTRGFDYFDGSHNGFAGAHVEHRRRVFSLHGELLAVADLIAGRGVHTASIHWNLAPAWAIETRGRSAVLSTETERAAFFSTCGTVESFRGDEETGLGWQSPAYGRVEPTTTIRITERDAAPFWIVSIFDLDPLDPVKAVETMPLWAVAGSTAHGSALRLAREQATDYMLFVEPSARDTGQTWRVGEIETDARMLFCRTARDRELRRVAIVDGSFVRDSRRRGVRLVLGHVVGALYLDEIGMRSHTPCAASPGS